MIKKNILWMGVCVLVCVSVLWGECGCTQMCSGWSVGAHRSAQDGVWRSEDSFRYHSPGATHLVFCWLVGWLLCLFLRQGPLLTWKSSNRGLPNEFQRGTYFCLPDTGITIAQHHTQRFHMDSDN